jgi:deazaflavin-dependent oxidoreductase (nitroreductase family)
MKLTMADRMLGAWHKMPPGARDRIMKAANAVNARLYTVSRGRIGGRIGTVPVLLLTTTGRRSGKPRTTPLFYLDDGGSVVVVASYGGDDRPPAWFLNLTANPEVTAQFGGEITRMRARVADAEEKARVWPHLVELYRQYDSYQARTRRDLPVVVLEASCSRKSEGSGRCGSERSGLLS